MNDDLGFSAFATALFVGLWVLAILLTVCYLAEIDKGWAVLISLISMPIVGIKTLKFLIKGVSE